MRQAFSRRRIEREFAKKRLEPPRPFDCHGGSFSLFSWVKQRGRTGRSPYCLPRRAAGAHEAIMATAAYFFFAFFFAGFLAFLAAFFLATVHPPLKVSAAGRWALHIAANRPTATCHKPTVLSSAERPQ